MDINAKRELFTMLRKAGDLHEASWNGKRYTRDTYECALEATGGDEQISMLLNCLLTAGYCEMWVAADEVLGVA